MIDLTRGRFRVRVADGPEDVARAQALRSLCFHGREGLDRDDLDGICSHVMVEDLRSESLVGCFRLLPVPDGAGIDRSYSARFYDLSGLRGFDGPMLEMGRFCIHPQLRDADVLRAAWSALAAHVDNVGIRMLFGCSSFAGTDPARYTNAFAMLAARHLGPPHLRPGIRAPEVVRFAQGAPRAPDTRTATSEMPPLLRTYLSMGGWVSDHAVVDHAMNTLHVFTGVEIGRIPAARLRALRALEA